MIERSWITLDRVKNYIWLVLFLILALQPTNPAHGNVGKNVSSLEKILQPLEFDFEGGMAIFPPRNNSDDQYRWLSFVIQNALIQDFLQIENYRTFTPAALAPLTASFCPELDHRCMRNLGSTDAFENLSKLHISYAIDGNYTVSGDNVLLALDWYQNTTGPTSTEWEYVSTKVISTPLESLTKTLSSSVLDWLPEHDVALSAKQEERIQSAKTNNVEAMRHLGEAYEHFQKFHLGDKSQQLLNLWYEAIESSLRHDSNNPLAWSLKGQYINLSGGSLAQARESLSKALSHYPSFVEAAWWLYLSTPVVETTTDTRYSRTFNTNKSLTHSTSMGHLRRERAVFAADLNRAIPEFQLTAMALLSADGRQKEALEHANIHLALLHRLVGDSAYLIGPLVNLGEIYKRLNNIDKEVDIKKYLLALTSRRYGESSNYIAQAHHNLAGAILRNNQYPSALAHFQEALKLKQLPKNRDRADISQTLRSLGKLYDQLGQPLQAIEFYKEALDAAIQSGKTGIIAKERSLHLLALSYSKLGNYTESEKYYLDALSLREANIGLVSVEKHLELGSIYSETNRPKQALEQYQSAYYSLGRVKGPDHAETAEAILKIGSAYADQNYHYKAIAYYEDALRIFKESYGDEHLYVGSSYAYFSNTWSRLGMHELALYYATLSVQVAESVRQNFSALKPELQVSFVGEVSTWYKHLYALLAAQGRLNEAESVLQLLKQTEQHSLKHRGAILSSLPISNRAKQVSVELREYFHKVNLFDRLLKKRDIMHIVERKLSVEQMKREGLSEIHARIDSQTIKSITRPLTSNDDQAMSETNHTASALKELLERDSESTAILYVLMIGSEIHHLLITADRAISLQKAIDQKQFVSEIETMRQAIRLDLSGLLKANKKRNTAQIQMFWDDNRERLERSSQALYRILLKPIEEELRTSNVSNLLIFSDGPIRYIPLAALYDGNNYLIENFNVAQLVGSVEQSIQSIPSTNNRTTVAFGTDEGFEFPDMLLSQLHYAESEIRAVVGSNDKSYFNETFTPDNFYSESQSGDHAVLHLSTHYVQRPGQMSNSHLLFGNRQAHNASEVFSRWSPKNLNVLVLSACSTALPSLEYFIDEDGFSENRSYLAKEHIGEYASGAETESFSGMAIRYKDVDTVVATSWDVNDASTALFMRQFYKYLSNATLGRAAALRQAQLDMLNNTVLPELDSPLAESETISHALEIIPGYDDIFVERHLLPLGLYNYSHPYFWAPFTLMGQWR